MKLLKRLFAFFKERCKPQPKYSTFKEQVDCEWAKYKDELMPAIMRQLDKELEAMKDGGGANEQR